MTKAWTFCTFRLNLLCLQVDLRLAPWEKRRPPGFPSFDPVTVLLPLADAYAGRGHRRVQNAENPRLHPTLARLRDLPADMLFVIPTVDILIDEQMKAVERLQREALVEESIKGNAGMGKRRIEKLVFEGQWHGWLECAFLLVDDLF